MEKVSVSVVSRANFGLTSGFLLLALNWPINKYKWIMENFIHFRKFSPEYWNLVQTCSSTKLDRILLEQQVVLISNSIFKSVDNIIHYVQYSALQYVSSTFCFILNTELKMLALSKNLFKKHIIYTRLSCKMKYNILNYSQYQWANLISSIDQLTITINNIIIWYLNIILNIEIWRKYCAYKDIVVVYWWWWWWWCISLIN